MRIPVNLATQPFRHNRAMYIGSALLAVIMIVSLGMLIQITRADERNKRDARRQLDGVEKQLLMISRDQATIDQELRQPKNNFVLEQSVLLNDILMRKGISWTKIFEDLEKIVPYNIRILQIRPQIESRNRVYLQMVIGSDKPDYLNEFLQKLEASDVFGATTVTSTLPPSQTDPLYRYQVSVIYAQKL